MTEAMPFLQKYDITFLRPPAIGRGMFLFTDQWNYHILALFSGAMYIPSPGSIPYIS